jgi:hypothetical protein
MPGSCRRGAGSVENDNNSIRVDLCRVVQFAATVLGLSLLVVEGMHAAAYYQRVINDAQYVNMQVYGLHGAPSASDLAAASAGDLTTAPTVFVDGEEMHPVSAVLLDVIRTQSITSMIDYPCREHRHIVPSVLKLAMNTSSTLELSDTPFHYFCLDENSAELARSSYAVRDVVGRRRGLHYVRQRVPGVIKMARSTLAAAARRGRSTNMKGIDMAAEGDAAERAAQVVTTGPELIFSWGGRTGGVNATTELRSLVLAARASGARLALVGGHAAHGTRWVEPPISAGSVHDLTTGRLTGSGMPYFPFGEAIVSVSSAYSPRHFGGDETRFLILYRLDALPPTVHTLGEEDEGKASGEGGIESGGANTDARMRAGSRGENVATAATAVDTRSERESQPDDDTGSATEHEPVTNKDSARVSWSESASGDADKREYSNESKRESKGTSTSEIVRKSTSSPRAKGKGKRDVESGMDNLDEGERSQAVRSGDPGGLNAGATAKDKGRAGRGAHQLTILEQIALENAADDDDSHDRNAVNQYHPRR